MIAVQAITYTNLWSRLQRLPNNRTAQLLDVMAKGISNTNVVKPIVINGRFTTSAHIAWKSKFWSSQNQIEKWRPAEKKQKRPNIRRQDIQALHPVKRRIGVIAKVIHKKTNAQVPVERVANSMGLAPRSSWKPSHNKRPKGNRESKNKVLFKYFISAY